MSRAVRVDPSITLLSPKVKKLRFLTERKPWSNAAKWENSDKAPILDSSIARSVQSQGTGGPATGSATSQQVGSIVNDSQKHTHCNREKTKANVANRSITNHYEEISLSQIKTIKFCQSEIKSKPAGLHRLMN